jgi:acetyltransferase
MKNGTPLLSRPIRAEDELLMAKFHATLSEESVRYRYLHLPNLHYRVAHENLSRTCSSDYAREIAIVVERASGPSEILAVARLVKLRKRGEAELAIVVSDPWQNRGIGKGLLRQMLEIASAEGVRVVSADTASDNAGIAHLAQEFGFETESESSGIRRLRKLISPALIPAHMENSGPVRSTEEPATKHSLSRQAISSI